MKQTQITNYLKLGILLFGISLIVASCQKDDFTNQSNESSKTESDFKITTLRKDKILEKKSLLNKLDKIETKLKVQSKATSINGREVYSEENGFTINTDYCKEIFDGTKYTYTFPVYREEDNGYLENLWLIEEADSTYTAYLVQYEFTSEDITAINFRQQINVENKITYIELNADELVGDIFGKYFFNGNCYDDSWVYQSGSNCTAGGNHSYSDGSGCNAWGKEGMATEGGYSLVTTLVPCDGTGGNPSDPSNGGNPPDYNPTNPNSNPNHGGGNQGGSTTVVTCKRNCVPQDTSMDGEGNDPCADLKDSVSDVPLIKTRLKQLKDLDGNYEKGFSVDKNPNTGEHEPTAILNNNNGDKHISIPINSNTEVVAHTHPDSDVFAMFSAPDIIKMIEIADQVVRDNSSTVNLLSITHILVVNGKTFALRFDDSFSVNMLNDIANDKKKRAKFDRRLKDLYESDFNSQSFQLETDIYKQQNHLYALFQQFGLSMSLYEANYDSNGLVDNWEKINKDTLEKEPCN